MYTIHEPTETWVPLSSSDQTEVRRQLERILNTHHFNNSRRYPTLLRFIVEETLEGRGDLLKERLLGIRVFDRPADYDTAADPIVRVTIAEIRKRIAQYYHDEAHDSEMRIELLPGRYAPEFRAPREPHLAVPDPLPHPEPHPKPEPVLPPTPALIAAAPPAHSRFGTRLILLSTAAAALILAAVAFFAWPTLHPSALDQLWAPILTAHDSILICIPTGAGQQPGPTLVAGAESAPTPSPANPALSPADLRRRLHAGPTFLDYESLGENVVYSDMLAALHITDVFAMRHRDYHVRLNVDTTLEDLRQGPSVLIGGLDNQWTLRAIAPLRFRFAGSDAQGYWIGDSQNPSFRLWSLDLKQPYSTVTRDYAVVARLHNQQTGQPQIVAAGIGMSGTAAAGEFLTDPVRLEELRRRIGPRFRDHDFEAVLSTDVVNGIAGSPTIIALDIR